MSPQKLAIFQPSDNHEEVIAPQVALLTAAGWEVHLVVNERLPGKGLVGAELPGVVVHPLPPRLRFPGRLLHYTRAVRGLRAAGVRHAVLNTAERSSALLFAMLLGRRCNCTGVLHNLERLYDEPVQRRLMGRVRKYFVLGDRLLRSLRRSELPEHLRFESFYPVFFPRPVLDAAAATDPGLAPGGLHLCVPGQLEQQRRDYEGLVDMLAERRETLPPDVRFVLLGNAARGDGPRIRARIEAAGLAPWFVLYEGFVPYPQYFAVLRACDAVLPLVHPGTPLFESYLTQKTTAAFNMAFAFHKPLLLHAAFRPAADFAGVAAYYGGRGPTLPALLDELATEGRSALHALAAGYAGRAEVDFATQQARYLEFVTA